MEAPARWSGLLVGDAPATDHLFTEVHHRLKRARERCSLRLASLHWTKVTMAHAHYGTRRTSGTQERIDRMVVTTMRRFFTIILSASSLAVIICYLGTIR
jgi:hypothetical protein